MTEKLDSPSLLSVLNTVLVKEYLCASRYRQAFINPLVFFAIIIALFPLGVSPEPGFLSVASVGVVWVGALLSSMLSLDSLFLKDFEDGSLEQMVLSAQPLYLILLVKSFVHWTLTGLPLILMAPLLALMLHLDFQHLPVLLLTLVMGTPVINLIGGIGAALTVSLRSGGVLVSLLVLPLTIPVLIFGSGAVQASIEGAEINGYLAILGMFLMLALTLTPFATSAALKLSVSN
jgi:heme exporter protein B